MIIVYQASFMSELKRKIGNIYGKPYYSVLITVSMNLFDQLVIITCDPVMEGKAPSRKGLEF